MCDGTEGSEFGQIASVDPDGSMEWMVRGVKWLTLGTFLLGGTLVLWFKSLECVWQMLFCLVLWYSFKTRCENCERQTSLYILSLNSCLTNDDAAEAPSAGLFLGPIDEGCALQLPNCNFLLRHLWSARRTQSELYIYGKETIHAKDFFWCRAAYMNTLECFWGAENASKIEGSRVGNPKDIVQ